MPSIIWSIDTLDWKTRDSASTQKAVLNHVKDGDIVSVKADNERGTIFNQVKICVDDSFTLEMHIDTDEANAAKIATGNTVTIIK